MTIESAIVSDWRSIFDLSMEEIAHKHGVTTEVAQAAVDAYMEATTDYYSV